MKENELIETLEKFLFEKLELYRLSIDNHHQLIILGYEFIIPKKFDYLFDLVGNALYKYPTYYGMKVNFIDGDEVRMFNKKQEEREQKLKDLGL